MILRSIPILVLYVLLSCTSSRAPAPATDNQTEPQAFTITTIDSLHITIISIPEISEFLFLNNPGKPLAEVAAERGYSLAVNASYFDYERPLPLDPKKIQFLHAGYLRIQDSVYADRMPEERQLTSLFCYNFDSDESAFLTQDQLAEAQAFDLVVQTGPQLIRHGIVQEEEIMNSLNGMGQHARTALASVNGNEHYIVLARKTMLHPGVDLITLGQELLTSGLFKGDLNVVNLDGGSSTSLYLRDYPESSFESGRQILPAIIGVK
ncbi:MAG: phosphodiester glycosidase family protein [Candidatus Marinimicrobia bacterium]|nr:phosphodiester glycosidase family protein [Candidatus Neomarinimicrobiota bacterium]